MLVSIYYELSLFNAHTMILIVHIFMNVNQLCLNQLYNTAGHAQSIGLTPYLRLAEWTRGMELSAL